MEKILRMVEIVVGVLVGFPVFVVTAYNLYRQEINPSALPLISILPNWHWAVWLSILLFICIVVIVLDRLRKNTDNSKTMSRSSGGGISIASGENTDVNAPLISDQSVKKVLTSAF